MAVIDYTAVNEYPYIKRIAITENAQKFILPIGATKVTFGSVESLYFTNIGEDGDSFGSTIQDFCFVPANNLFTIHLETGRQANREILVAVQSGSGYMSIIVEKDK